MLCNSAKDGCNSQIRRQVHTSLFIMFVISQQCTFSLKFNFYIDEISWGKKGCFLVHPFNQTLEIIS